MHFFYIAKNKHAILSKNRMDYAATLDALTKYNEFQALEKRADMKSQV